MAFIRKNKNGSYCVHQGNTGKRLSCHGSGSKGKKDAEARLIMLHKTHQPKTSNRGKTADKRDKKRR